MRYIIVSILFICTGFCVQAQQDSIKQRILLIGDGGEINAQQKATIADAKKRSIPGKTTAIFLGDNIYPSGIGLDNSDATKATEDVLRSQFAPLHEAGIPVYFVPGNHDWDHSGIKGFEKILRANEFLAQQGDSLLQMIPPDACPGPYELHISNDLVIVAIDSEWWLFPYNKGTEGTDCECKTKNDILGKLDDILQRNKNKTIIFTSHHPFKTYGSHGGYYSLKEHVFPLTDLNKNLYIPLPVIGSLYPILRKTFPPAEDVKNLLYQDMKNGIEGVLKNHPNVIHAAGHEHTLQLIQGAVLEIVSGAGCKNTPVKKGNGSLFAESNSGYVVADLLVNNILRISFYSNRNGTIVNAFNYDRPYTAPKTFAAVIDTVSYTDSVIVPLPGNYNKVNKFHRKLFGENYRDIWATPVKLPVLKVSKIGLTPTERGGGMQTRSLRLEDTEKKEWVLRSVDKYPDALLPSSLTNTLAASILKDNVTAAFPYAPMVVPVFADALHVYHSNPKIVYVAPDTSLGIYNKDFAQAITLFEEREPVGKSTSTIKMVEKLKADNDNTMDQEAFFTARLLDIFIGDWDRHADQWRWVDTGNGKAKIYKPVPRDRDQVFYINEGFFPGILSWPWIQPKFQGFGSKIVNINTFSFNAREIDGLFTNKLSFEKWMSVTNAVTGRLTDQLIDSALTKIPSPVYEKIHVQLAERLRLRKLDLLKKSPQYFRFLNRSIDITASDKNELVLVSDTAGNKLVVTIYKLSKNNEREQQLYYRLLDPAETKEVNIYLFGGADSVVVNNQSSPITLRVIGDGKSAKNYQLAGNKLNKVHIYEGSQNAIYSGEKDKAHLHLSDKPANTAFVVTSRYHKTIPLATIGYNVDDGLVIGAGVKFIRQGFRKSPYASSHQFNLSHAFNTNGYRFRVSSEWLKLLGNADLVFNARVYAPDNAQNFFGRGNESGFNRTGNFKRYYRSVFTIVQIDPAIRWRNNRSHFSIGPSLQYYNYDADDNAGRFITNPSLIKSYDSATIDNDKMHAGVIMDFTHDSRNYPLIPSSGVFFNIKARGYGGLNDYSKSFGQVTSELSFYKAIDRNANFVLANRIGGGLSVGKTTFYQSMFLGGHENLLGYRQYRYAGQQMVYNNFEARIRLANVASYILPGQLGLVGFYDVGRVWEDNEVSKKWHQGAGGGLYFAPAQMLLLQLVAGKSTEGWYPYFTMGFRF